MVEICWCLHICLLTNGWQDPTAKSITFFTSAAYHTNALIASNKETFWKTSNQKSTWHIYIHIYEYIHSYMYTQRVYIHCVFMCLLYVCCYMSLLGWFPVSHPQFRASLLDASSKGVFPEKLELSNDLFISIEVGGDCLHQIHSNKPPRNLQGNNRCPTARSINPWRTELEVTVPWDEVGRGNGVFWRSHVCRSLVSQILYEWTPSFFGEGFLTMTI